MSDNSYDADILLWSERQAALLRKRSVNELDWDNIAEEIESVGRSQLHAVQSHIVKALLHDLKAEAWPLSRDVEHWRAEARLHRAAARRQYTSSMRQRLDMAALYRDARDGLPDTMYGTQADRLDMRVMDSPLLGGAEPRRRPWSTPSRDQSNRGRDRMARPGHPGRRRGGRLGSTTLPSQIA